MNAYNPTLNTPYIISHLTLCQMKNTTLFHLVLIIISQKNQDVAIEVELEQFYQGLLRNLTHIPDNELTSLKTKLRSTCEKYSKINVSYKYKKVIDNLSKNKNIVILKLGKGRGIVILDTTKYTEKCMAILNTERVKRLTTDTTAYCSHRTKDTKSFEKDKI